MKFNVLNVMERKGFHIKVALRIHVQLLSVELVTVF